MDLEVIKIAENTTNYKHIKNHSHKYKHKNTICGDEIEITLKIKDRKISSLFDQDKNRAINFSVLQEDLFLDFSKTNIDQPTLELLINLAKFRGIS